MSNQENYPPTPTQLNTRLRDCREAVDNQLYGLLAEKRDIIDPDKEFSYDVVGIWEASHGLAFHLEDDKPDILTAETGLYRGMIFAQQVLEETGQKAVSAHDIRATLERTGDETIAKVTETLTRQYRIDNPQVDQILNEFMSDLEAPDYSSASYVEIGATLVFMASENTWQQSTI